MDKNLFLHLLDITVYNANILYKQTNNFEVTLSSFRLQLIKNICELYLIEKKKTGRPGASGQFPD